MTPTEMEDALGKLGREWYCECAKIYKRPDYHGTDCPAATAQEAIMQAAGVIGLDEDRVDRLFASPPCPTGGEPK